MANKSYRINNINETATYEMVEVPDGHLDMEIETFIAATEHVQKDEKACSQCQPVCKIALKKSVAFLPVMIAIGYLVYVAFALYAKAEEAIAVTVLTPVVVYVCLNRFSNGKVSKCLSRALKKICAGLTPSRRVRLWTRR